MQATQNPFGTTSADFARERVGWTPGLVAAVLTAASLRCARSGSSRLAGTWPCRGRRVHGEGALARMLLAVLGELGLDVTDDGSGLECGNVIARLAGDPKLEPLMFTSHMDVVAPCQGVQPRLEDGVFVSAGDTVLGADAKASVAALLEAARVLRSEERRV